MEVKHFKMVVAIAETGSLTAAAEKLFLTQPALSHQLKEIETELGCQLFTRVKRKLVLTTAGKAFLNSSYSVVNEISKLQADIRKILTGETGRIRLATESSTCYHWLPRILKKFQDEFPNVEVHLGTGDVNQPLDLLLSGKLDVAIVHRKQTEKNIEYIDVFEDEVVALMAHSNPLSSKEFLQPQDFRNLTYITHSKTFDESAFFQTFLKPHKVLPKKIIYIQLTEAVMEMVREDLGVAVMASWLASPYFHSHNLQAVRITRAGLKRKWYIATLKSNNQPGYIERFIEQTRRSMLDHYKSS